MPEVPKYVPLSELERVEPNPKVRFDGVVPEYVDQEQIGIHLRAIHTLCRLGGIRSLQVIGTSGEVSSFTPDIAGWDNRGRAVAAWKGTAIKVSTYDAKFEQTFDQTPHAVKWVDAVVSINMDEAKARIGDSKKFNKNLRSPHAWSTYMNHAVKSGIRKVGVKHLVEDALKDDAYAFAGVIAGSGGGAIVNHNSAGEAITAYLFGAGGWSYFWNSRLKEKGINTEGWRLSAFFFGPQLDRAIILEALGRTKKLVRAIPPEK